MNSSYESGPSSTPNPQRAPHQHHQHHHSTHKSPHSASTANPEDSPAAGRQRVRTEPSPRHQHTSSGWLGPYNEQPSPLPGSTARSPRGPRLPGSQHPSQSALDRTAGAAGVEFAADTARAGSAISVGGQDRILDTHRVLGGWQMDAGSSSYNYINSSGSMTTAAAAAGGSEGRFERREFDPKQSDAGFAGPLMEPSNSLQSLVESIDDDHVFKLTEMTKKRVEHNNPAQKRQRVVSLPTSETTLAANFQPSEKTLQFSSSCKSYLESRYTQLYQSIHAGQPINRLRKLHEIDPQLKPPTPSKHAHDSKDSTLSRSRRLKNDKYRFVDKVEESSCIWDVDHMEAKAATEAAADITALAKQTATAPSSRHGSQQNLEQTGPATSNDSSNQYPPSASTESFGAETSFSGESYVPLLPPPITNYPYHDSPLAAVDAQNMPVGMSPSSTFSSITSPTRANDSAANSFSSLDATPPKPQKENSGESKLRFVEAYTHAAPQTTPAPTFKFTDGGSSSSLDPTSLESSPSKRNSFLGIFGVRGKKVGQDSDQTNQSPQSSSYGSPRLTATAPTQERRSFDSSSSPYFPPTPAPNPGQRSQPTVEVMPPSLTSSPSVHTTTSTTSDTQSRRRTSLDEAKRAMEYGEAGGVALTDDDNGGHFTAPSLWPQGERMDESQDESDNPASATYKRSSLRRFKDKMTWKRGHKTLSAIQQGETSQDISTASVLRNTAFPDGSKSLGKKVDPALAYLHEKNPGRMSTSEPSSGRNSIDGSSRPKLNFRMMSNSSSPVLEAVKTPDGTGFNSPRVGPMLVQDNLFRTDKSPMANASRIDKSPMILPLSKMDKSPMLNPSRIDKSPMLMPTPTFVGEDGGAHGDFSKQTVCIASQLLVDVDRIPKRMLQKLKLRPELASIDWSADTVDLSAMWSSAEPLPTYDEYVGISKEMKSSQLYPSQLKDVDVLQIHLTLDVEEPRDISAKNRVRKWDLLELRVDQEVDHGEKWIKEVTNWSGSKINAIERHLQASGMGGLWQLDENAVLVEEPEAVEEEDGEEGSEDEFAADSMTKTTAGSKLTNGNSSGKKSQRQPHIAPLETFRARKQQRGLSLSSVRDLGGSMSSLHTSVTYTFKASLESTQEAVKEMRVYLEECRQRLKQLNDATGDQLLKKEPVFKDVVDKFTMEWNESYFVKLKEVEDQIQVMNLKRIENPWMDMLLIMLSWFIRGLFYIVEGVTIMIIIVRHAWGKAKKGYEVVRNSRREQERMSHYNGNGAGEGVKGGRVEDRVGPAPGGMNGAAATTIEVQTKVDEDGSGDCVNTGTGAGNGLVSGQTKYVGAWV